MVNTSVLLKVLVRFFGLYFSWGMCHHRCPSKDIMLHFFKFFLDHTRNKMHKQILDKANESCRIPRPFFVRISFKPPYNSTLQSMLLPHILFSTIYHQYPQAWSQMMLPSLDRLKEFWKLQRAHPQYQSHPVLQSCPNFDQKMLPLAFHGDGTPVIGIGKIWSRQLTIFSWNSLLGFGMTREMQLHIWSFFDECSGPGTLDEFFTILSWSFAALQTGKWPETNHLGQNYDPDSHEGKLAGTLLADGFSAIVWSLVVTLSTWLLFWSFLIIPIRPTLVHCANVLVEQMTILGRIAECLLTGCPCNGNLQSHLVLLNLAEFAFSTVLFCSCFFCRV